ncbi:MAG: radical SAM protein, partial [Candidatus Margulisbacteria bacterium]|nr:radical SAM protein [Candidatus Margulisiibacteriota bacterium]
MKRADIKIGYLCNNHCLFCVQGKNRELYGNKSCAEIKKAINLARKTCQDLVFTGGEATLRNDFLELVSYAKKLGFRYICVITNGIK